MKAPPPIQPTANTSDPDADAEPHGGAHRLAEAALVAGAEGLAAELLGRGGEPVQEIAAEQEEVVQDGVGGERHVAGPRALRGEERESGQQRDRPDGDVAVDGDHPAQRRAVERLGPGKPAGKSADAPQRPVPADEAGRLGQEGRPGGALDAALQHRDEQDRAADLGEVQADLQEEAEIRPAAPDQGAQDGVVGQGEGPGPDADADIVARRLGHGRARRPSAGTSPP